MNHFSVVSVDMFQTLIDVNSLRYVFWQKILGENYSESLADEYTTQWGRLFPNHFNNAVSKADGFLSLKRIFENFFADFFSQMGINYDPGQAAQVQVDIHRSAPPYEDTAVFLKQIWEHFNICLVTDSDKEMISPHLDKFGFKQIFISESLKAYKNDSKNRMFQAVISHYPIPPEKIFHIGDMESDIVGAGKAGITTCWLNRDGKNWSHTIQPDYEVNSLIEVAAILGRPIK